MALGWFFRSDSGAAAAGDHQSAIGLLRDLRPGLLDEALLRMLDDIAEPVELPWHLRWQRQLNCPNDPKLLPSTVNPPSGGWKVRSRWRNGFNEPEYYGPDIEKAFPPDVENDVEKPFSVAQRATNRGLRKRDLAERAINALWPNGVPPELQNKKIEKRVGEHLKQQGLLQISRDTILRAAGRK